MTSLIKKPSELDVKTTLTMLVYGQPGVGKSTLGVSAPNAVLFDYDGGVQRVNAAHQGLTVQIRSWEDTQKALEEITNEYPEVQTIIIDTVGKMIDFMSEYITRTNPRMKKADGSLSLQGYGLRKNMFIDFIAQTAIFGKNVIFIAHEKEERRGEETVKRPEVGGSSANDLIKELDLVGYMQMIGKERTIAFNPTEWYYAKNTVNLPAIIKLPLVVDENGNAIGDNNFIRTILTAYHKTQNDMQEQTQKYDELIDTITNAINLSKTAEDLNKVVDYLSENQIFNSKIVGGRLIVRKAKELGFSFNNLTKKYE